MTIRGAMALIERDVLKEMRWAANSGATKALEDAKEASSGEYSAADLARMDHPYARRHSQPLLQAEIINKQTGAFYAMWASRLTYASGLNVAITNNDWKADWIVKGNKFTHERPIDQMVAASLESRVLEKMLIAKRDLERKHA